MRLIANEKTLPRIHLIGTLLIVLSLTIVLAGYYSWQSRHDAQSSLAHIEQALNAQSEARLKAEMNNALSVIEFTRKRSEFLLSQSISRQVESAHQIANAIYARESGRRPASEVRKLIVETLRPVHFYDGRGYFFIDDMKGNVVLLPRLPNWKGKTLSTIRTMRAISSCRDSLLRPSSRVAKAFLAIAGIRPAIRSKWLTSCPMSVISNPMTG